MFPDGIGARINLSKVPVLPVFKWLASAGDVAQEEMLRTFNCGIGMIVVVAPQDVEAVSAVLRREGDKVVTLGELFATKPDEPRVRYTGTLDLG